MKKIVFCVFATSVFALSFLSSSAQSDMLSSLTLQINLEKSPSFSVKSETWLYDNTEQMNLETVVANASANAFNLESPNCLSMQIQDFQGAIITSLTNNQSEFCQNKEQQGTQKIFHVEPYREYYFQQQINLSAFQPGAYTLKITLGGTPVTAERTFYILDSAAECFGIPQITAQKISCPFQNSDAIAENLDLQLELPNSYVSSQETGLKNFQLSLTNNSAQAIRLSFLDECLSLSLSDEEGNEKSQRDLSFASCQSAYINIGTAFIKSNRLKVLELQPFEAKILFKPASQNELTEVLELPLSELSNGDYNLSLNLKGLKNVQTESQKITVRECPAGYTAGKDGKCQFDPQGFYQDKIEFELDFETLPKTIADEFIAYATIRNLTDRNITIPIAADDCFSFYLNQQKELFLRELTTLSYQSEKNLCLDDLETGKKKLVLSAAETAILKIKISENDYKSLAQSQTVEHYTLFIEARINKDIRSKLKSFSVGNSVKEGEICGGPANILCAGEGIVCEFETKNSNKNPKESQNSTELQSAVYGMCEKLSEQENYFLDIEGHFGAEYIEKMHERGIVEGYPGRLFKPDQPISRAEFVKMIVTARNLPLKIREQSSFTDIDKNDWFHPYIETAKEYQIIEGDRNADGEPTGTFRPLDNILRQEAVKIVVNSFELQKFTDTPPPFIDIDQKAWYYDYLFTAYNAKVQLIQGYADETFRPQELLTRAEAAKIISVGRENLPEQSKP